MYRQPIHRYILVCLLLLLSVIGFVGEKIPVNHQTGWDGKHYANLTIHFNELISQKQVDSYQYQRIATPAFIYYSSRIIGVRLTADNIVFVFGIYNMTLILLCVLLFFHLTSFLQINPAVEVIGFCSLFFNYVILKNTFYYPVLTDTTAFFMGFCITYLFIRNYKTLLLMAVLFGQFCYPLFLVASSPLALGIRNNAWTSLFHKRPFYKILAGIFILLVMFGITRFLLMPDILLPSYTLGLNRYLLPVSMVLLGLYLWRGITTFQSQQTTRNISLQWKSVLFKLSLIGLFWGVTQWVISRISIPEDVFTPSVFINNILQQSIDNPLAFIVAHITYLGPAILLVICFFRGIVKTVTQLGDSAIGYTIIILLLSIGSETRQFIHFYPFVIIVLLITLNRQEIPWKTAVSFALLSVVASKCWFPINTPRSFIDYAYMEFPNQRYFMNHGPFMNDLSYLIDLAIALVEGSVIWYLFKLRAPDSAIY